MRNHGLWCLMLLVKILVFYGLRNAFWPIRSTSHLVNLKCFLKSPEDASEHLSVFTIPVLKNAFPLQRSLNCPSPERVIFLTSERVILSCALLWPAALWRDPGHSARARQLVILQLQVTCWLPHPFLLDAGLRCRSASVGLWTQCGIVTWARFYLI